MPLPGSYNSPLRKWGVSGTLSTSVWERSRRTRGQTRMGPLISCFMYDGWHVFEYLHVSEGDANREEKSERKFRELRFLCQQRLSVNSRAWCNSRAEPETPTAHIIHRSELHLHILTFSKSVIKSQLRIQLKMIPCSVRLDNQTFRMESSIFPSYHIH